MREIEHGSHTPWSRNVWGQGAMSTECLGRIFILMDSPHETKAKRWESEVHGDAPLSFFGILCPPRFSISQEQN